jgi:membrane peptidoglycan carboxypeptidase
VRYVIERDPAFGATAAERTEVLKRGGLNVYTTLDWRLQNEAQSTITEVAPTSVAGGKFGAASASIEAGTGRILSIAQNTKFSESITDDVNYTPIVYAGDLNFGNSIGFSAGSTFKLFTLVNWLENGHSVREVINGNNREITTFPAECLGGVWAENPGYEPGNFDRQRGYVGTPMQFTAQSLNSGYLAMAAELDICDIIDTAAKMGVAQPDGEPFKVTGPNQVIGNDIVSPIAIAGAYATVANNGIYCEPQAIDRVTDSDGNEVAIPERTCSQVIDPKVAATAAYALEGVMSGGTGRSANPYDGTPLLGKTGTHQEWQTWMVESSSKVATAAWVGNAEGKINIFKNWHSGNQLSQLRYIIAEDIQRVANQFYPGTAFPGPDSNLSRQVLTELPNVVGKSVDEARKTLEGAGFQVIVGDPVDSDAAPDIVAAQNPGAGQVAGGTTVTINPSNGQGITVPDVSGFKLDRAVSELRQAGFGNVQPGSCSVDENADGQGTAVGTDPAAGQVVNRNTAITVSYTSPDCGGGGGGPGGGNGNDDNDD